jgi:hypothetical protein
MLRAQILRSNVYRDLIQYMSWSTDFFLGGAGNIDQTLSKFIDEKPMESYTNDSYGFFLILLVVIIYIFLICCHYIIVHIL